MDLTSRYTQETGETPFDHQGGYTYEFTRWVMKVAKLAITELTETGVYSKDTIERMVFGK